MKIRYKIALIIVGIAVLLFATEQTVIFIQMHQSPKYTMTGPTPQMFTMIGVSMYESCEWQSPWQKDGTTFTWWEYLPTKKNAEYLGKTDGFIPPGSMDCENHSYIVTYGRKIVELEHYEDTPDYGKGLRVLLITFSEEEYDKRVFFYELEKQVIVPSDLRSPTFVMQGDEKVYKGIWVSSLNEADTEKEGYYPAL